MTFLIRMNSAQSQKATITCDRKANLVPVSLHWLEQMSWANCQTSYRGHSTVKPQHWSTWWMSDQNESSHGFTSFEFMHGEACQGREMMWTLALTVCQDFTSLPLATRLKLVICCLAACCQYAWESRFNICGLLKRMNAIRLFCGCKASLCIHHAIYHFNGHQRSQGTRFNLVTTLVYSFF